MWRKQRCRPIGFSVDLEAYEEDHPHFADDFIGSGLDPEEEYRRRECSRLVAELLAELPPKYREVVWLCKIEEWKITDAAEKLGVPVGTIKARMHRARRMIEKYMTDRKGSEEARLPGAVRLEIARLLPGSSAQPSSSESTGNTRTRGKHSRRVRENVRGLSSSVAELFETSPGITRLSS